MAEMMSLNISQSVIEAAIREEVNAGIVRALGDPSKIVREAVQQATNLYVRRGSGEPCRKDNYDSMPYFEWLATDLVKDAVRKELKKYVEEHTDDFRQYIIQALSTKQFKKATAEAFIKTLLTNADSEYRLPITIGFEKITEE